MNQTTAQAGGDAPLVLTDGAVKQVKKLAQSQGETGLMLRVFIAGGGCSGFQYGFEFDREVGADDVKIEKNGATVVVDSMSMQYLNGAEVGFQEDLTGAKFTINNPNANTTCGCGASFSV